MGGHPDRPTWFAITPDSKLMVFRGDEHGHSMPFPDDQFAKHYGVDVSPSGVPVVHTNSLSDDDARRLRDDHISRLAVEDSNLVPLFTWTGKRVVSIAVGPKMAWDE